MKKLGTLCPPELNVMIMQASEYQIADIYTKAVSQPRFWQLVDMLNMMFRPATGTSQEPEPVQ